MKTGDHLSFSWFFFVSHSFDPSVISQPYYFEHSKYSSFIRQSNGWGFRRITQGPDRNAYYHEQFLRGLPHLCKSMKRPGIKQKKTGNPEEEPDFYKISNLHPVPEKAADDSILLECTMKGGPKARMPIYTAVSSSPSYLSASSRSVSAVPSGTVAQMPFQNSLALSTQIAAKPPVSLAPAAVATVPVAVPAADTKAQPAFQPMVFPAFPVMDPAAMAQLPGFAGIDQASAAQFAAGFAMAAAYSQQTFMTSMMEHMKSKQKQEGPQAGTSQ